MPYYSLLAGNVKLKLSIDSTTPFTGVVAYLGSFRGKGEGAKGPIWLGPKAQEGPKIKIRYSKVQRYKYQIAKSWSLKTWRGGGGEGGGGV